MKYFKETILYLFIILVLSSLIGCRKIDEYLPETPLDRDNYAPINLEERLQRLERSDKEAVDFWNRMELPNKLEQIQRADPIDVGLHFVGYPNIDDVQPDKVLIFYTSANEVIVFVLAIGLMDDSVLDSEERIDLHFDGNEWRVEWAGYRQRCRRNNNPDWITGLCP
jgi:hypothetical protein